MTFSDEAERRQYAMSNMEIDYSDLDKETETKTQFRWRLHKELRQLKLLQENLEVDVARTTKKIIEIEEIIR